ncbi:hypothetical protein PHISCL_09072 [Aspergillus sclerotialis]|uniref:Uncharacterized protein n=1 Tax=Aspergillus sclerotialis TaxID=2070753 RepID=A0A3A2ZNC4_9EURO|nr:hypothetical protein PHISCL_09072 [Aspergillus sclerotialis]
MFLKTLFIRVCLLLLLGEHSLGLPHSSHSAADGYAAVVSLSGSTSQKPSSIHHASSTLRTTQVSASALETTTEARSLTHVSSYKSSVPPKSQSPRHPGTSAASSAGVSQPTSGHMEFPKTSSPTSIKTTPLVPSRAELSGHYSSPIRLATSGTSVLHISEQESISGSRTSLSPGPLQSVPSRTPSSSKPSDMPRPSTTSIPSWMSPALRSSTTPLTTFTSPPPAFYASSVAHHLSTDNTLITTEEHGRHTVIPVFGGFALHNIRHTRTYFNLPSISGGVQIPCLISCSSGDFPSTVSQSSSADPNYDDSGNNNNNNDDDGDDNQSSSSRSTIRSCTSTSTSTISSEFAQCNTISTKIAGPQPIATTCSTSTITSVTTGCDILATARTSTTMAPTSIPDLLPLTVVSFIFCRGTSVFITPYVNHSVISPSVVNSGIVDISSITALTYYREFCCPTPATAALTRSSSSTSPAPVSPLSPTVPSIGSARFSRTTTATPKITSSTSIPHSPTFRQTVTPPILCHQNGNPDLASPRCECTQSSSIYFRAPLASNSVDPCGYKTVPSTTTITPTITPPPTVTDYVYTDAIDSIVKSCATASVVPEPWAPVPITTCNEPTPISTLRPQPGTATIHVWESWPTDEVSPKAYIAAIMNDTDQVTVAKQEPVEVNLGENITIPISNIEQYPMNIEPVSGFNLDKRDQSWLERRIAPPSRSYPVDHSSVDFYVNGFTFNSKEDSEGKKGKILPYCSVDDWDYGSAADQFADFVRVFLPIRIQIRCR